MLQATFMFCGKKCLFLNICVVCEMTVLEYLTQRYVPNYLPIWKMSFFKLSVMFEIKPSVDWDVQHLNDICLCLATEIWKWTS